jgi:hypothetical protein
VFAFARAFSMRFEIRILISMSITMGTNVKASACMHARFWLVWFGWGKVLSTTNPFSFAHLL